MFRRAAINAALGAARSFHSNLERWRKQKAKAEAKGRRFTKRPPVPPRIMISLAHYGLNRVAATPHGLGAPLTQGCPKKPPLFRVYRRIPVMFTPASFANVFS
jgi:hypothetical protein